MKNPLSSLLIFLLFLRSTSAVRSSFPADASPSSSNNDTDFIRTSCGTTLYPQVCYTSLSRYAAAVQSSPSALAKVAIAVSFSTANRMSSFVYKLNRAVARGPDRRAAAALGDCMVSYRDAVDQIRDSLMQMKTLGGSVGHGVVRFQMNSVQTWMSAALTYQETCTDGLSDVADDATGKAEVMARSEDVKKVTSNALALVNVAVEKMKT